MEPTTGLEPMTCRLRNASSESLWTKPQSFQWCACPRALMHSLFVRYWPAGELGEFEPGDNLAFGTCITPSSQVTGIGTESASNVSNLVTSRSDPVPFWRNPVNSAQTREKGLSQSHEIAHFYGGQRSRTRRQSPRTITMRLLGVGSNLDPQYIYFVCPVPAETTGDGGG